MCFCIISLKGYYSDMFKTQVWCVFSIESVMCDTRLFCEYFFKYTATTGGSLVSLLAYS